MKLRTFNSALIVSILIGSGACTNDIADPDPGLLPISDFIYQPQKSVPLNAAYVAAVNFAATSKNASSYVWDFGNNNYAYTANAEGQYLAYGTYKVSLTSINKAGISTKTESIVVAGPPIPKSQFILSFDNISSTLQIKIQNTSTDAARYEWDFGDGLTSTSANPGSHTYVTPGSYRMGLTVYNADDSKSNTYRITVAVLDDKFLHGNVSGGKTWVIGTGTYLSPAFVGAQGTYYIIRGGSIAYTATLQSCELNDTYMFKPTGEYINNNKLDARIAESGNECRAYLGRDPSTWKLIRKSATEFQLDLGSAYMGDVKPAESGFVYDVVELKNTSIVLKYDRVSAIQAGSLETVVMVFYPQ
jgi:PKD repeat protein